jgi:antitoxin component of MazEF toxin-antitoxin module
MEQIMKAKKWGNSLGVILPKFIVDKEKIDEGTELIINIRTKHKTTVADLMKLGIKLNLIKKLQKINTQEALKNIDRTFEL